MRGLGRGGTDPATDAVDFDVHDHDELGALADSLFTRFASESTDLREMQDVLRLLAANRRGFERLRCKSWFKRAWFLVTGERGRLRDLTLSNLGQVQVVVLKALGTLMQHSEVNAQRIVLLSARVERIRTDLNEVIDLVSRFNAKHRSRYQQLMRQVEQVDHRLRAYPTSRHTMAWRRTG